jgi:transcriptional regulator with XRE-family HTH domain
MIGDRIRGLREQRAWTQAHLADASGVSLRTIQRLEKLHSCSSETLLALAAALNVDVRELTGDRGEALRDPAARHPLFGPAALLLTVPGVLFVTVNLLKFAAGWAAPFDLIAAVGRRTPMLATICLSPLVILGGPVLALALVAAALLRPRIERRHPLLVVSGIELEMAWPLLAIALAASAAVAVLLGYAFVENVPRVG